ncbi:MAG: alpha-L-fucosidase [Bacteroidetes bacterium GWF2_38_335]|nr:MAG: alpha-L-fucosidase [Bacteroidetes bacterium GWF2_38_335]OFY78818.1 MAG: alpha-L-fucosidase [Bacteroidetes bacterium RIFOXYA12_FULL_38_20]
MRILLLLLLVSVLSFAQEDEKQKYYPETDPLVLKKLEEWQDMKFGLLMHWGAYSQWGIVESWSICPEDYGWCERKKGKSPDSYFDYVKDYENLKTTFNPTGFEPENWAKAAKDAGMKYVVFTTKHHDGFCMFDSKETDYKITDKGCPFSADKRSDVTKEIFNAFRKEGLWTGAYFSKPDWHSDYYWYPYFPPKDRNVNYDPIVYPELWQKFVDFTHNQIMELMTGYGNIDILWLDGGWVAKADSVEITKYWHEKQFSSGFIKSSWVNQDIKMDEMVKKAREKQSGLIVVDRAVEGKNQNYLTPENRVPEKALPYPWESCIIAGGGWAWVPDPQFKSSHELIQMLVDIVCKGGNLLLNIAPSPEGKWHPDAYARLSDIGDWMKINSEAIYETRAIEPYKERNICYTNKKNTKTVYLLYLAGEEEVEMPGVIRFRGLTPAKGTEITMLGTDTKIEWALGAADNIITIPPDLRKNPPCKHVWVFKMTIR